MRADVRNGVIDIIRRVIADTCKIILLNCGNNLLDEGLLEFYHFEKVTHLFGVQNSHVLVHLGGCAIRYDEWTRASRVEKGCV